MGGTELASVAGMLHLVAHTVRHRLLFTSEVEGAVLFRRLSAVLPVEALCLMPDHVHLVASADVRRRLAAVLSGWARRCNHVRGEGGALMRPLPPAEALLDAEKVRRSLRYVHLNPCRGGLVDDPLAWPLSSHRDACGLTLGAVGPRRQAVRFHKYVSSDPSVAVHGSELPAGRVGAATLGDVLVAVSAVTRTPMAALKGRGTRSLVVAAAQELSGTSMAELARALGCHRASLYRLDGVPREAVDRVQQVLGDARFGPIDTADLRRTPAWQRYLRS
jgi:putative transposase